MSSDRDEQLDEETPVANAPGADEAPGEVTEPGPAAEDAESDVEQDLNALVEEARSQRDQYLDLAQRTATILARMNSVNMP